MGQSTERRHKRKLVVVGDGACGKTCLLIRFVRDEFYPPYLPTVFDTYVADIDVNKQTLELSLWDTAGQEEYDTLRPLSYPDTDVILLCFAVAEPDAVENVSEKWVPEIHHYCPNVPYVLVGCKMDERSVPSVLENLEALKKTPVTPDEGKALANRIGAQQYLECSARTGQGIREVFDAAAKLAISNRKERTAKCCKLM